tara:strand:- start:4140 stop:5000 length:861 start_codon:yes stop_codon:yes gene_type:complete
MEWKMENERQKRTRYFFGVPFFLWYFLVIIIPFLFLILNSFFSYKDFRIIKDLTISNYVEILSSDVFYTSILNSLKISLITTVLVIFISFLVAYFIYTRVNSRYQKIFILALLLPLLTNYLLRSYSWSLILSNSGIVNWILLNLHIINEPLQLLFSEFGIIVGLVAYISPIVILIIFLGLTTLDKETIKASADLGANERKTVLKIVIPQIKKFLVMGMFFTFVISFSDFVIPSILGGGNVYTYSFNIIDTLNINNLPKTAALGTIILLFFIIIASVLFKIFGGKDE